MNEVSIWFPSPSAFWSAGFVTDLRKSILVPRGRAPFGQHQGARPLARDENGREWLEWHSCTSFPYFYEGAFDNLTKLKKENNFGLLRRICDVHMLPYGRAHKQAPKSLSSSGIDKTRIGPRTGPRTGPRIGPRIGPWIGSR